MLLETKTFTVTCTPQNFKIEKKKEREIAFYFINELKMMCYHFSYVNTTPFTEIHIFITEQVWIKNGIIADLNGGDFRVPRDGWKKKFWTLPPIVMVSADTVSQHRNLMWVKCRSGEIWVNKKTCTRRFDNKKKKKRNYTQQWLKK